MGIVGTEVGELCKEVVEGHARRGKEWLSLVLFEEKTVEEQPRTLTGEDDDGVGEIALRTLIEIVGDVFEEWCHKRMISFLRTYQR
jgi:hypothetical protein